MIIKKLKAYRFGDKEDGVIGMVGETVDGNVVEISYFFGINKPKNIFVISSQAGCPMRCQFCELGSEKFVRNLDGDEIIGQFFLMMDEARDNGFDVDNIKQKITIANTGEPFFNPAVVSTLHGLSCFSTSYKVSTIFPETKNSEIIIRELARFAVHHAEPVQIQVSLISTSEEYRNKIAGAKVAKFKKIRKEAEIWRSINPNGRKMNLSLILTSETPCNVNDVYKIFPAELFRFRFREYVPTRNGRENCLQNIPSERFLAVKKQFADMGYDVNDAASPTPTERKYGLASNVFRRMYLTYL